MEVKQYPFRDEVSVDLKLVFLLFNSCTETVIFIILLCRLLRTKQESRHYKYYALSAKSLRHARVKDKSNRIHKHGGKIRLTLLICCDDSLIL